MNRSPDMTVEQFDTLRSVITIARNGTSIRSTEDLKKHCISVGLDENDVNFAIDFWKDDLKSRYKDLEDLARSYSSGPGM